MARKRILTIGVEINNPAWIERLEQGVPFQWKRNGCMFELSVELEQLAGIYRQADMSDPVDHMLLRMVNRMVWAARVNVPRIPKDLFDISHGIMDKDRIYRIDTTFGSCKEAARAATGD